jgi:hypothetical protein
MARRPGYPPSRRNTVRRSSLRSPVRDAARQPQNDFRTLADEYATAGGINEQFLTALRRAGTFNIVDRALDDVARRLEDE